MRRGNLIWGSILILAGVLVLLDAMRFFWPILLIGLGLWIVAGAFLRGTSAKSEKVAVDLQSAGAVSLRVSHGAGQLRIAGGATTGMALEGECTDNVHVNSQLVGDRLDIRVGGDMVVTPFAWNPRGLDWDLRLTKDVPVSLDLETGANQAVVDLSGLRVPSLSLKTGASSTDLILPASGVVMAEVHMGAADVKVRIPQGMAARIRSKSGLADVSVDTARFPRVNGTYESPDFTSSLNRVELLIEVGVGRISIQ